MTIDSDNPVVRLCAEGMAVEGDPAAARALFAQAWAIRRNDYDACIAAHFVARHQDGPEETLRWNALAVSHAEAVADGRATTLLASLYLNLGESYRLAGDQAQAVASMERARGQRSTISRSTDTATSLRTASIAFRLDCLERIPRSRHCENYFIAITCSTS